jgi:hypothetical protein
LAGWERILFVEYAFDGTRSLGWRKMACGHFGEVGTRRLHVLRAEVQYRRVPGKNA